MAAPDLSNQMKLFGFTSSPSHELQFSKNGDETLHLLYNQGDLTCSI